MARTVAFAMPAALPFRSVQRHKVFRVPICATTASSSADVLIVAANRGLGAHLTRSLRGSKNVHTTHRPQSAPSAIQEEVSIVHTLDALDGSRTEQLLCELRPQTVVSCLGGNATDLDLPDYEGNKNLIDASLRAGTKHFILLSALGAGNSEEHVPSQVMGMLRNLLEEKTRIEAYLKKVHDMYWTIVRPAPLVEEKGGEAVATEDVDCYGVLTRPGLSEVIKMMISSDKARNKTLHVVDKTKLLIVAPFVRPREFWEPPPFTEFEL